MYTYPRRLWIVAVAVSAIVIRSMFFIMPRARDADADSLLGLRIVSPPLEGCSDCNNTEYDTGMYDTTSTRCAKPDEPPRAPCAGSFCLFCSVSLARQGRFGSIAILSVCAVALVLVLETSSEA